jgi:glycosyltransferase involved in cell wall biosynthesis
VVLPLQWEEPFGLVAVEAMLCGTPVLGFPRGSFPEIVEEGLTGFLAPLDDTAALGRLAANLAGFDRAACANRARQRFTTQVMADAYEALYARVAERHARARAGITAPAPDRRSSSGR